MNRIRPYGPGLVLVAVTLLFAFAGPHVLRRFAYAEQQARRDALQAELRNSPMAQLNDLFRNVAKFVEPSVVHIEVARRVQNARVDGKDALPEQLRNRLPRGPQVRGNGSGWVYAYKGKHYIITNNHVIRDAVSINAKFFDKSNRQATVVGADAKTDIVVLRVDDVTMHPAKLATKAAEMGEIVFAFGSPFQFEFSVSQGIVSGKGRQLGILAREQGYENFIQTDAAINPGNSGGPLTNVYGEVVGMNTAIATRTGASNGLAFAIPADMIRNIVDQIIDSGTVSRGYLGVWIRDLDPKLAKSFGFEGKGVLVDDLVGGDKSPAAQGGMEPGDVITKINGRAVASSAELRRTVAAIRPERKIDVEVFRDGKTMKLGIKLGKLPGKPTKIARAPEPKKPELKAPPEASPLEKLGFQKVETFTDVSAKRLGVPHVPGVLVTGVAPQSPAAKAGLARGLFIITHVMRKPIASVDDLNKRLEKRDLGLGIRMRVRLGDINRFVFLSTDPK
jgi:serine protease Do